MKTSDVCDFLDSITPLSFPEDGLCVGDPATEVTGILTCWMPNVRALRRAVDTDCNVVVFHEIPYYSWRGCPDESQTVDWACNDRRRALIEGHGLVLIRCHRSMDTFCVAATVQDRLGLPPPALVEQMAGYDAVRVFNLEPAPLGDYVERWKAAYGLERIRLCGPDLERSVSRAGLAWGGIGLYSNFTLIRRLGELGCDVLIGGETEEYTIEFCVEHDIAFVELGHAITEAPGMTAGGAVLREAFPGIPVVTFEEWPLYRFV